MELLYILSIILIISFFLSWISRNIWIVLFSAVVVFMLWVLGMMQ